MNSDEAVRRRGQNYDDISMNGLKRNLKQNNCAQMRVQLSSLKHRTKLNNANQQRCIFLSAWISKSFPPIRTYRATSERMQCVNSCMFLFCGDQNFVGAVCVDGYGSWGWQNTGLKLDWQKLYGVPLPGWQCWLQWWIPGWWGYTYKFPDACAVDSISAAIFLFHFVRRFWNQIFIWVSVSLSDLESSVRREIVKYLLLLNSPSSSFTCVPVNAVRFRFFVGSLPLLRSCVLPSCCSTKREKTWMLRHLFFNKCPLPDDL